jgi:hypothetical protein
MSVAHNLSILPRSDGLELVLFAGRDIRRVSQEHVVADLAQGMDGYDPETYFKHSSLAAFDHLLLARDGAGRCRALLGTKEGTCCGAPFLFLVTGFVVNEEQGKGLMRRMIARTLLSLARRGFHPGVLAARTYNPVWYRMLEGLGAVLPGSVFYPRPSGSEQDPELARLAADVVACTNPGAQFDAQLGVLRDGLARTPTLFRGRRPRSGDGAVDGLFHDELGAIDLVLTLLDIRRVSADIRRAALTAVQSR